MDCSTEFFDCDLLGVMTAALDAAAASCVTPDTDAEELRFAAARHILARVGAGERDCRRLEHSALTHLRERYRTSTIDSGQLPCAHRSSA